MSRAPVRTGQLIAPFGPGSIYTDRKGTPLVVCGLDYWYHRENASEGGTLCDHPSEFDLFEPRLLELLRVDRLRAPAPFRPVRRGGRAPENAQLFTPAHRFPTWHRNTKSGLLKRFNLHATRIQHEADGSRWQPVRFISVCKGGHLAEFPWKQWARCSCNGDGKLVLTDFGGSDLSSISVYCKQCGDGTAKSRRTLAGVMQRPSGEPEDESAFRRAGIDCPGHRPWLGEGAEEPCSEDLIGALINQTNIYFPRTMSAILLPELATQSESVSSIRSALGAESSLLMQVKLLREMQASEAGTLLATSRLEALGIQDASPGDVSAALESLLSPSSVNLEGATKPVSPEPELSGFRRAEFNVLRRRIDETSGSVELRVIPTEVPQSLVGSISMVHLVERLKETRVFFGFDRVEPSSAPLNGMPETAMAQLFRTPPVARGSRWLPAIEVFGEGIYLELDEVMITEWRHKNAEWLAARLQPGFVNRMVSCYQTLAPSPASEGWAGRYLLVHTLAHALINQLVFECGYSSASLRERLYISDDAAAPMAGILIYTAAGDSEGTLGGLVTLGRPENLGDVILRALSRASWCSADPICSENLGGQGSKLANLGACHSCVLLPETSCETINQGLDRAMLVGTPSARSHGAFSHIVASGRGT